NNPAGVVLSDGLVQAFRWYPDDRSAGETGRLGETISRTYDAFGDLRTVSDSTSSSTVSATYYLDGLTRTVSDPSLASSYAYDGSGQLAARTQVVSGTPNPLKTSFVYGDA